MSYPYAGLNIANEFIRIAREVGQSLTHMKLQKLAFFAHGWNLALTGQPLVEKPFQAWNYGPVNQSIYDEFRSYGSDVIQKEGTCLKSPQMGEDYDWSQLVWKTPYVPAEDQHTHALLRRIWEVFGGFDAFQLSNMTHCKDTPWEITVRPYNGHLPAFLEINNELIRQYFVSLYQTPQNA